MENLIVPNIEENIPLPKNAAEAPVPAEHLEEKVIPDERQDAHTHE